MGTEGGIDAGAAFFGPVDVLQVNQQREFVEDEGRPGALGGGGEGVAPVWCLAVDGDATDPGE